MQHGNSGRLHDKKQAFFIKNIKYYTNKSGGKYVVGWHLMFCGSTLTVIADEGKIEALYDINGIAAKFPAHCVESEKGIENLKLLIVSSIFDNIKPFDYVD